MPVRLLATAAALAAVAAASGCTSNRELVVLFRSTATAADRANALHACATSARRVTPEPMPTSSTRPAASRSSDVRFRIDRASDRDIARLESCLSRQPGVLGFQDTSDVTG